MGYVNGNVIIKLREMRGWDQKTLAAKAGIDAAVLSRMERELQSDFKISMLIALAKALDVSIDSLLHEPVIQHPAVPEWQTIHEQVIQQSPTVQQQAAAIMRGYLSSLISAQD